MPPRRDIPAPTGPTTRARAKEAATIAAFLVLIASAGLVGLAAFDTAGARISDSTNNQSNLFEAAEIDLDIGGDTSLLFDADRLYPGLVLERCIEIAYIGSLDEIDIRLSARRDGGDGLELWIETSIETGTGTDPECADFARRDTVFDGRLGDVWASHPTFATGLPIGDGVDSGFETTLRVTAEVVDDNAAQSLTTDFWMTVEARP